MFFLFSCSVLSDWLEVKFGLDGDSDSASEQLDGTLRTLCVSDTLLEKDECRVYVSIKVRLETSGCAVFYKIKSQHFLW